MQSFYHSAGLVVGQNASQGNFLGWVEIEISEHLGAQGCGASVRKQNARSGHWDQTGAKDAITEGSHDVGDNIVPERAQVAEELDQDMKGVGQQPTAIVVKRKPAAQSPAKFTVRLDQKRHGA